MSKWQLFWAMVALATAPLFAETTTNSYPFRYSTLERVGALSLRPTSEATGLSFTLSAETFDKAIDLGAAGGPAGGPAGETVAKWRPVAFVPPEVKVTAISVAIPGTEAPASLTVTPAGVTFTLTGDAESVTLTDTDGSTATATLRTYENTDGVLLTPDKACAFSFADAQTGTAISNFYTFGDKVPHLRITGTASITRHVITISDGAQHSFDTLLKEQTTGYQNEANHVIVVEFSGNGGTFSMDSGITASPLVIGSSVSADKAFVHATKVLSAPLSLRDGDTGSGGITLTLPQYHQGDDHFFGPSALLLDCDLTLKSLVPLIPGSWLTTHAVPIPAGRTFRLELSEADFATAIADKSESLLPSLSFADATSRLELATQSTAVAENPLGIPLKYQKMLNTQSGTLVLDRDVNAPQFTLSDWRALYGVPVLGPLETHLILRDGHTYTFNGTFGFSGAGALFGTATLTIEGGTVTVGSLNLTATDATLDIQGGTVTADGLTGIDEGVLTRVTVAKGATLSLSRELPAGTKEGVLDLTVAGTLNLTGDVYMRPAARRTLRVEDGTIHATSAVKIECTDGGTSTAEDYLVVSGGGTLKGPLTVDSVTGNGLLTIGQGATVTTLYAYNGTIEGEGTIGAFTGDLGDVTLGGDWLTGAGKTLADVVDKAKNYHGTLGFTAGTAVKPKVIDFASVKALTELPGAFRVNDYQNITMRLDQYIDATVRWPSPATGVTLTLIESGAYGGEAEIPAVPAGVDFAFQYYDAEGALQTRPPTDYQREPSEDGVSDELTWEDAVFTGQGAWIDVEFEGADGSYTSANTGWFNLGTQNGCLVGLPNAADDPNGEKFPDYRKVTTDSTRFTEMGHPVSGGMKLGYRPYIDPSALKSFPEEWSLAVRMTAPKKSDACMLAIGNNYDEETASDKTYALVFATGAVETKTDGTTGTTEIVLWKFDGRTEKGAALGEDAQDDLFRVKVAAAQDAPHVFSVVCDGETLNLYMDGAWLNAVDVPDQALSGGLQVGQQLGGSVIPSDIRDKGGNVMPRDGGAVDYIRFYKGAFPEAAMVEMADRTPYVRENLRYVRYVPASNPPEGGETWIQKDAWLEQTWDETKWVNKALVDQPAEGAECRILVDAGEHAIQVNVERQVEATAKDGTVTNEGRYFYSPNRTYASLVVRAQDEAARAATLRLVPLGVTKQESDDTDSSRPWETQLTSSAWFTTPEESSPGNRTGFRYGKLRFTGGAGDPINDDPAITEFHGAGYLLDAATSGKGMNGIFDAGVCYLSKYAQVVLQANETDASLQSTLEMVAGRALTRGVMDEVARWQLTGPVVVQGTTEAGRDYVLGHAGLPKDQASEDVWVPFFGADSTWKFYDDTRVEGGTDNGNGAKSGLFARGVQTPGRLYLDFTVGVGTGDTPGTVEDKAKPSTGNFSEQAWYRYGYEANQTTSTLSGMKPERAKPEDFDQAVAFQIRLDRTAGDIVTLTLDKVPKARVQTFHVEEAAETTGDPLTLALKTKDGVGPLKVWQRVIAAARLDVSNRGKGNALNLRPEGPTSARRTPIHRGNSTRGAYVVGNTKGDWDFGAESSVPRLEVAAGCTLTFTVGQDLRRYGTTVAAQSGAYIHHTSNEPFLGQDVELAAGATFGFHATAAEASGREEGVVLAGRLVLHGTATLRAEGGSGNRLPRFFAVGGIVAAADNLVLTVHAEEGANWRSRTAAMTGKGFGLRKTGPGAVTFDAATPPSVSGKVTVEEGTLAVTADAATPVGSAGLEVREGATLGDSRRMVGEGRLLAAIPDGQTLSGGGTVDGVLRLESGATYRAAQDEALTVTGGLDVGDGGSADINVTLPANYVGDTPYLVSGVEERTIRRRFEPTLGGARWDAIAWLQVQGGKTYTYYAARKPALPVPTAGDLKGNETENAWHDGFERLMVNQYQSLGHAYVGATQGRTRAGSRHLSASEINDALYAFSGISAFQPSDGAETETGRTYIDAHNFYVAYEFGISSMAFATIDGEKHVVVEVKVQNALADTFGDAFAEGAAAFRSGTKIAFQAVKADGAQDLPEDAVTEVANLKGDAGAASGDTRYFAMPYEALKERFGDAPILLRPRAVNNEVELPAQQ